MAPSIKVAAADAAAPQTISIRISRSVTGLIQTLLPTLHRHHLRRIDHQGLRIFDMMMISRWGTTVQKVMTQREL
jgi:hypothetical protein